MKTHYEHESSFRCKVYGQEDSHVFLANIYGVVSPVTAYTGFSSILILEILIFLIRGTHVSDSMQLLCAQFYYKMCIR